MNFHQTNAIGSRSASTQNPMNTSSISTTDKGDDLNGSLVEGSDRGELECGVEWHCGPIYAELCLDREVVKGLSNAYFPCGVVGWSSRIFLRA